MHCSTTSNRDKEIIATNFTKRPKKIKGLAKNSSHSLQIFTDPAPAISDHGLVQATSCIIHLIYCLLTAQRDNYP
jgi:hypothetical protein